MKTADDEYELIPMSDITDEARKLAVAWMACKDKNWIRQKHKLASDIMNYAKKYHAQFKAESTQVSDEEIYEWANNVDIVKELNDPYIKTEDDLSSYQWAVFAAKWMRDRSKVQPDLRSELIIAKQQEYIRYLKRAIHSESIINNVTAGVRDKYDAEIQALIGEGEEAREPTEEEIEKDRNEQGM